jgi:hypothetical protein
MVLAAVVVVVGSLSAQVPGAAVVVKQQQKNALVGNSLFLAGAAIQYGLVYPRASRIDPDDLGELAALASPQLLAMGLKMVGTPTACLAVSQAREAFGTALPASAPRNLCWKLYWSGWGFFMAGYALATLGVLQENPAMVELGGGAMVGADVIWLGTGLYAWWSIHKLGLSPDPTVQRVSLLPLVVGEGGGLGVRVAF